MPKTPSSPHKPTPAPDPDPDPETPPRRDPDQNQHQYQTTTPRLSQSHSFSEPQPFTTPLAPSHNPNSNPDPDFDTDSPLHFSPSKARAAAQATQHLNLLTRWLSSIIITTDNDSSTSPYDPLITKWLSEHQSLVHSNPALATDTLQWLQDTMTTNRHADERARLIFEAKRAELDIIKSQSASLSASIDQHGGGGGGGDDSQAQNSRGTATSTPESSLLAEISSHLTDTGLDALDSLAETSVRLGHMPSVHSTGSLGRELGQAVMQYTVQTQELQGHLEGLQDLQRTLAKQLVQVQDQLAAFQAEKNAAVREAEVMHPQTAQWNRETKLIALKIGEYQDRVAALERSRPGAEGGSRGGEFVRVEDVVEMQERVGEKRARVGRLEERVKMMHGLPPDLEASRDEVKRAKAELERLRARREELFGVLAERS